MLGYTYQDNIVAIGTKSGTTRTAATLTAAYTGNISTIFSMGGISQIQINVNYTTGSGETNNSIEIRLEAGPDGTNMYQLVNDSTSGATSTLTQREFTFVGAAAATAYSLALPLVWSGKSMRVAVKETGVVTNFGTAFVEITVSGAK